MSELSPKISVCVSMYNASLYIQECIDSILSQNFGDFELIIVDDGSTDDSLSKVESYGDGRIRIIRNSHDYIGSLNKGIAAAKGRYIARMDADDIMAGNRLRRQYSYMEQHRDIDVLFGGIELVSEKGEPLGQTFCTARGYVSLGEISEGCCLAHPTAFIRASSISYRKHMLYDPRYAFAEDYNLWVELLTDGLALYNSDEIFGYYRRHAAQVSEVNGTEQTHKSKAIRERAVMYHSFLSHNELCRRAHVPESGNKLTIVIPFLNEKEEVRNTVESIRSTAGDSVDIIVINDNSDRGYDYVSDLSGLNVVYIKNEHRIGAAMSKEKGVGMVRTPFFLMLDAHMRFYDRDWAQSIVAELEADPNRLLCCQTSVLVKDKSGAVRTSAAYKTAGGAYMSFAPDSYVPGIKWNHAGGDPRTEGVVAVPCVLGAGYASSKPFWEKIAGMRGLQHYGCEEVFISAKAWMGGGGCYLLPDVRVGHLYRQASPYKVHSSQYVYNYLLVAETLFPTSDRCLAHAVAWKLGKQTYFRTLERLNLGKERILRLRSYFNSWGVSGYESFKSVSLSFAKAGEKGLAATGELADSVVKALLRLPHPADSLEVAKKMAALVSVLACFQSNGCAPGAEEKIERVWSEVAAAIPRCNDFSFSTGLSGCGWLLVYASERGLIEDDVSPELRLIDRQLSACSPKRITDLSLMSGLGGVYAYVTARLGYNKRRGTGDGFDPGFMRELTECTPSTLDHTTDWRTFNFALQFKKREDPDWTILRPNLTDVADAPKVIPSEPEYWDYSINGVAGNIINFYQK